MKTLKIKRKHMGGKWVWHFNGFRLPQLFVDLWETGKWKQSEKGRIESAIPWIQGEIEFIEDFQWLESENSISSRLKKRPFVDRILSAYNGNKTDAYRDLPYLDTDRSFIFAVNRNHGDDLCVAMDFRTSLTDPRVIATYWPNTECAPDFETYSIEYRLASDSFSEFVERIGLLDESAF